MKTKTRVKYRDRVKIIRRAAELAFKGKYIRFRQTGHNGCDMPMEADDPLAWRLDVIEDGLMQSHAVFNLRKDYTKKRIQQKFLAMVAARAAFLESKGEDT